MRGRWTVVQCLLLGAAAAAFAVGCGYQPLGVTGSAEGGLRVAVEPITNQTFRPGVQGAVAGALLRELRLRGILRSPEAGPPDVILSGSVTAYLNEAIAFNVQDIGRRFRVRITVLATLVGRTDGKVRLKEAVVGEAFYTAGTTAAGTRAAEDEAVQGAAQDAASKLVARLLEEW
jgi:hypothetical protein